MKHKSFGVLLPVSALPGEYGIGDLGTSAYHFIDWLEKSSASIWQVLPTTIADPKTGCPYSSMSAFGGYLDLISPELLCEMKLLDLELLISRRVPIKNVEYSQTHQVKLDLLKIAFDKFCKLSEHHDYKIEYNSFLKRNIFWADDLANFLSLSDEFGDSWWKWDNKYSDYQVYKETKKENENTVNFHLFSQYIFDKQWNELKNYANEKNISIIGDIPIFLSHHSMDVWKNPHLFKLNEDFTLRVQTGVPPDVFSEDGQCWSTPNYDWEKMKDDNFLWWKERIQYSLNSFDIIRFDHFIGLVNVFEIPPNDCHAKDGNWVKTPGRELLTTLKKSFPNIPMIVEDLGEKCPEVDLLKDDFGLPGMKILMFAYSGDKENEHLPSNYSGNEVVYTGTHDNNTLKGHFKNDASSKEIQTIKEQLGLENIDNIGWDLIEESLKSKASIAITPLQDLIGLGEEARFNLPGTILNNWVWRFSFKDLPSSLSTKINSLVKSTGRNQS